jgi:hypothetical protein
MTPLRQRLGFAFWQFLFDLSVELERQARRARSRAVEGMGANTDWGAPSTPTPPGEGPF